MGYWIGKNHGLKRPGVRTEARQRGECFPNHVLGFSTSRLGPVCAGSGQPGRNRDHTLKKCCSMGCLSSSPQLNISTTKRHEAQRAGNKENCKCCGGGGNTAGEIQLVVVRRPCAVCQGSGHGYSRGSRAAGHHPHSAICRRTPADLPGSA